MLAAALLRRRIGMWKHPFTSFFFLSSNATWQMIEHDNFSEGIVSQQGHDYPTTVQTKEATKRPFGLERRSMEASRVYSNNILTECVASLHLFSN